MHVKKLRDRLPTILLALALVTWGAAVGALAQAKLYNLASSWAYDLAFFHNLLFNSLHGAWFTQTSSPHEASGLLKLHHTYPILLAVLPLYALAQKVSTLVWIQVLATASAAIPVSRLARRAGASPMESTAIAVGFLIQAPLVMTALCDFRPIVLCIPLLLWTTSVALEGRKVATLVLGIAALAVREDMVYLVGALGLALACFRVGGARRPMPGLSLCVLAVGYWFAVKAIGGELTYYFNPMAAGGGSTPLSAPTARDLLFLAPYLLPLGLAAPLSWPLLAPGAMVAVYLLFLSPYDEWSDWLGVYGHHSAPLLASIGAAAAVGWARVLVRLKARWRRLVPSGLVAIQAVTTALLLPGWLESTTRSRRTPEELLAVHGWIAEVAEGERVASDYSTMAVLSGRRYHYAVPDFEMTEEERYPWSGEDYPPGFEDVDVILLDAEYDESVDRAAARCPAFRLLHQQGVYRLYERVAAGGEDCTAQVRRGEARE